MRRFLRSALAAGLLLAAALAGSAPARGAVILGNLAGNSFSSGYFVGPGGGLNNSIVQGFTMTDTYNLQSVTLYLSNFTANASNPIRLSIYSNKVISGHNAPDANLYNLSTNVIGTVLGTPTVANFTGTGSFLLEEGKTYWLNLYSSNPASGSTSNILWNLASPSSPTGPGATYLGQTRSVGAGNPPTGAPSLSEARTAFQLNGTLVVPEPSALFLSALGSAALIVTRRKWGVVSR